MDGTVEFTVGYNKDCKNADTTDYCNGVVRPEKEYYVILRGYTEKGFTNSPPSEPIMTSKTPIQTPFSPCLCIDYFYLLVISTYKI